jgi:hypothetical protein
MAVVGDFGIPLDSSREWECLFMIAMHRLFKRAEMKKPDDSQYDSRVEKLVAFFVGRFVGEFHSRRRNTAS